MSIAVGLTMAVVVAGAFLAVALRNILHAIFGLALSLVGVAGLFLLLGSPFVATMEVLIYVGGISVAMVFAVMLSTTINPGGSAGGEEAGRSWFVGVVPTLAFMAVTGWVVTRSDMGLRTDVDASTWLADAGAAEMGRTLLVRYNLVFEVLSVVLLLAIVGAVCIARRQPAVIASDVSAEGEGA